MKKKKFKFILFLILIVLFVLLFIGIKDIYNSLSKKEVKTLSSIEEYNYTLNENDSPYFKKLFGKLQNTLSQKELDEEKYAKLISQLFTVDFYSLKYAVSGSDIGGVQFVYSDYIDSFTKKAKDTIYANVESNVYGNRKQELPNVKKATIKEIKQDSYEGAKESDEKAYFVDLTLEYDKDLDYDSDISLVIIHKNNKLEIVKMN